jgi:hypothetical protein
MCYTRFDVASRLLVNALLREGFLAELYPIPYRAMGASTKPLEPNSTRAVRFSLDILY